MTQASIDRPSARWLRAVLAAVALIAVGAAAAWAVATVLRPAEDPLASTKHSYAAVEQGSVGYSLSLNTLAEWQQQPIGTNRAAGTVTTVDVGAGGEVSSGAVLYTVDLRPVVVAQGTVPMFRSIGPDAEGSDVRQLQEMLAAGGYFGGSPDGNYGAVTERAVRSWQKASGLPVTGVVEVGDIIFVPSLPARVTLDSESISRGSSVGGGENALNGLSTAPVFEIPVTEAQASMMPTGTRVAITAPGGEVWEAFAEEQERSAEGAISVRLQGAGGGNICGDACAEVPPTGKASLKSQIVVVDEVEGLVVPSAALVTTADGETAVIDAKGEKIVVEVVASANGMSVVTGVDEGTRVEVPATEKSTP